MSSAHPRTSRVNRLICRLLNSHKWHTPSATRHCTTRTPPQAPPPPRAHVNAHPSAPVVQLSGGAVALAGIVSAAALAASLLCGGTGCAAADHSSPRTGVVIVNKIGRAHV